MMTQYRQKPQGFVFTGWHMMGIMVLFFGTIITVNMIMAWNASRTWSGLVVQNTYVASQQFNRKVADARALAATGIDGDLVIANGRVTYRLADPDGKPVPGDVATAIFKRPVDERKDFTLALLSQGGGVFAAEADVPSGQWIADISTTLDGEKVFHQTVRTIVTRNAK